MACKNCKDVNIENCSTTYCGGEVSTPCKIKLADRCVTVTAELPNIATCAGAPAGTTYECQDLNTVLAAINTAFEDNCSAGSRVIAHNQFFATDSSSNDFPVIGAAEYRWAGEVATGVNLWNQNTYTEGLDSAPTAFSNASDQRMAGIPVPFDIAAGSKIVLTGTFTNTANTQINGRVVVGLSACASPATAITTLGGVTITTAQIGSMYTTCFREEFTVPTGGITKGTDLLVVGWQVSQTLTSSDNLMVAWTISN